MGLLLYYPDEKTNNSFLCPMSILRFSRLSTTMPYHPSIPDTLIDCIHNGSDWYQQT